MDAGKRVFAWAEDVADGDSDDEHDLRNTTRGESANGESANGESANAAPDDDDELHVKAAVTGLHGEVSAMGDAVRLLAAAVHDLRAAPRPRARPRPRPPALSPAELAAAEQAAAQAAAQQSGGLSACYNPLLGPADVAAVGGAHSGGSSSDVAEATFGSDASITRVVEALDNKLSRRLARIDERLEKNERRAAKRRAEMQRDAGFSRGAPPPRPPRNGSATPQTLLV